MTYQEYDSALYVVGWELGVRSMLWCLMLDVWSRSEELLSETESGDVWWLTDVVVWRTVELTDKEDCI